MTQTVRTAICIGLLIFQFAFLLRLVLTIFPLRDATTMIKVRELAFTVTEPVVHPIRRRVPPLTGAMSGFGIAELLVLVALWILTLIFCS